MAVLDVVEAIGPIGFFVIMSSGLAAAMGAAASLPHPMLRFLGLGTAGEGLAPQHMRWLAVIVFTVFTLAVLAAELKDLLTPVDPRRSFLVWLELTSEAIWILYLAARAGHARYSGARSKHER